MDGSSSSSTCPGLRRAGWACRTCHKLIYRSSQERRKLAKVMRELLAQLDRIEAAHREQYRRCILAHAATDPNVLRCDDG